MAPLFIKHEELSVETLRMLLENGCTISQKNNFYKIILPKQTTAKKQEINKVRARDDDGQEHLLLTHSISYMLPKGLCILYRRMALTANRTYYRCTLDVGMEAVRYVTIASFS